MLYINVNNEEQGQIRITSDGEQYVLKYVYNGIEKKTGKQKEMTSAPRYYNKFAHMTEAAIKLFTSKQDSKDFHDFFRIQDLFRCLINSVKEVNNQLEELDNLIKKQKK